MSLRGSLGARPILTGRLTPLISALIVLFACHLQSRGADTSSGSFISGTFRGLIQAQSFNDESYGFFTFALTRSGAFSGRFTYGKNSYPLHGKFNPDGSYRFEGPDYRTHLARPRFIDLQLSPADGSGIVTGNITDLTHDATLSGDRARNYSPGDSATYVGSYTFGIRPAATDNAPRGSGFGRVTVDSFGRVAVTGFTGDGTPFTEGTSLAVGGRWPMYARLPGTAGVISGEMIFRDTSESDFDGSITWLGTEVPFVSDIVRAYVNNFVVQVDVVGSRYRYNPGTPVLNLNLASPNARLNFAGGAVDGEINKAISLSTRNQVLFVPRGAGDSMTVSPTLGFFTGSFYADRRLGRFRGVVLQKQNAGVGFFLEGGQAGNVWLLPD